MLAENRSAPVARICKTPPSDRYPCHLDDWLLRAIILPFIEKQ